MVIKGRIYEELRDFEISFEVQSNRTIKSGEIVGKFIDLERRLDGKSTESKIAEFGSRFVEKSTSEVDRNI